MIGIGIDIIYIYDIYKILPACGLLFSSVDDVF